MTINICRDCEQVYESMGQSHYCPTCRKKLRSETAKKIGLNKLGNNAYSKQQKMLKEPGKTECCGKCQHFRKGTCRNTESRKWSNRVSESEWCSHFGKEAE